MQKLLTALVLASATALFSSAAAAQRTDDAAIRLAVEHELQRKDVSNGNGPWVEVKDGLVTLRGKVRSVWSKDEAIRRALKVEGVRAVEDRLEIAFGESDQKVAEEISKEILRYPYFTVYDDVSLAVEGGDVTLKGRVTMPFKARDIERRASKVMGVQSLRSEIQTLPTSIEDGQLRRRLTERIYGDLLFSDYAYRVNPPIHIIVERGRVTLTGAVRSQVEKRKAEHIARSTFGVFFVENRLSVGN